MDLHWSATSGDGGSGVVLSGEDVARGPGKLSTESLEGLNENSGLNGCGVLRQRCFFRVDARGGIEYSCAGNQRCGHP